MFEVLAFVYENYWSGEECPRWEQLERKLNLVGFEADEIRSALTWLSDLNFAASGVEFKPADVPSTQIMGFAMAKPPQFEPISTANLALQSPKTQAVRSETVNQTPHSMRIYSAAEQDHLGPECLGFISFLEATEVLPPAKREMVLDSAMAAPGGPMALDDLKIIVLMVYWSLGETLDALVLDELCDDASDRVSH